MKKFFFSFLLVLFTSLFAFSQIGSWTQKANFGGLSRSNAVGFSIGSYGYMGTGTTGSPAQDFWRYDPSNNSWTQKANFGGGNRWAAAGFSIGNYGYIGTGSDNNTYYNDFWQYDPSNNTWTQKANFGGSGRYYAFGFSSGHSGYIGTGANGSQAFNDFYRYNPGTNTWTARANFNNARMDAFAFYVNGKGFAGTGRTYGGSPTYYNDFYQYDSTTNAWTAKANFGGSVREGVSAFVIGNYGYAGTGSINNFTTDYQDFYKYNPTANTWTAVATFTGSKRTTAAAFAVGNFGYIGTGFSTSTYVNDFFQYDLCGLTTTLTATSVSCNGGSNGSANVTSISNGTNPYSYLWSSSSTTSSTTGLSAGNYSVTITDAVGCTKTSTVNVTQPSAITLTSSDIIPQCYGGKGTATVNPSGGTPGYNYSWNTVPAQTTQTATGLAAGNYSATVTDSKGCTATASFTITQPTQLTATISSTNSTKACTCNGTATVTPSGGTAGYTYSWSNGSPFQTATGLCGGTYSVIVVDANGCTATAIDTIAPSALTLSMTATPATCPSCANGSAAANSGGGNSPFTYSWTTSPVQTTQTATGLTPAYYHVCVTDADTCVICDSIYVGFAVSVHENFPEENVLITPNPSVDGKFQITNFKSQVSSIEVYNLVGEKIYELNPITQLPNYPINISSEQGVYFLKIKFADAVLTRKIIVSR